MVLLTFLAAAELLDALLLVMLAVETDTDAYTSVILDTLASLLLVIVVVGLYTIRPALDDEATTTGRDEFLEHGSKLAADLSECTLDGLVLTLIEDLDEFFDGLMAGL